MLLDADLRELTAGTYATVGTVSAPALLGGLVDLDVLDDQVGGVETLGIGVGLSVLEEAEEDLGGLDGPAGLGDTESLACGSQPLRKGECRARYALRYCNACPKSSSFYAFSLSIMDPAYCMRASLLEGGFRVTHPGRCVQCCRRSASWGRPPCAPGRYRGKSEHARASIR